MLQALLIVANVVQFGLLLGWLLGTPRPRHVDGWLHAGVWCLDIRRSEPHYVWHLDGIPHAKAPRPPRQHKCQPQTCTITSTLHHQDRCACGAARVGVYGQWLGRNSRWDTP